MKRNGKILNNHKITSYFTKNVASPIQSASTSAILVQNDTDDEDIIPDSPVKCSLPTKLHATTVALDDISNKKVLNNTHNKRKTDNSDDVKARKKPCNKSLRKSPRKSPTKRRSPLKLFQKSPKVKEFQVDVLRDFIKVTPSKSERGRFYNQVCSPKKSCEKVQQSILNYTSPKLSKGCTSGAQTSNEKTPVNYRSFNNKDVPSTSKVKIKLDFDFSGSSLDEIKLSTECSKINKLCVPKVEDDFQDLLNDSFDDEFLITVKHDLNLETPQHCKVLESTTTRTKQIIEVQSTKSLEKAVCILKDFWLNIKLQVGCKILLTAYLINNSEWVVDNKNGLLVYEPDLLISSTTIVGANFCKRKSILKSKYGGFDGTNKAMLIGNVVHALLQDCLKNNITRSTNIEQNLSKLLTTKDMLHRLYESEISKDLIQSEVQIYIPRIISFMQQYLSSNQNNYQSVMKNNDWKGKIDSIQDIEENIWCTDLGIKGKIDVSVQVRNDTLPLELKTGRASMSLEHRGQIILYIIMMRKLGYNVSSGLLLYLREGVLKEIIMNEHEKRDLIILRNQIAFYLLQKPTIDKSRERDLVIPKPPPPINHHSACKTCEYNVICSVFLKTEEYNLSKFQLLKGLSEDLTGHLAKKHLEYFIHWSALDELETSVSTEKSVRDIYRKLPEKRQKQGKCIINTKINEDVLENNGLYLTSFSPSEGSLENFHVSGIGEQNYVVVSTEKRPAVSAGMVTRIDLQKITIELDRDLKKKYPNEKFHLDTYGSSSQASFNLTSLTLLLEATPKAEELRKIVIDKIPPTFKTLTSDIRVKAKSILKRINTMQQRAVFKALAANQYLLIKGMPGTGKTATIVALVEFLVELNQSVLITSHTNLAVDNVCKRLIECGVKILRLGRESRMHPLIKSRSEHVLTANCKTVTELEDVYNSINVVAVTCLGSRHPLLSKRTFDFCIVDESTQVVQTSLLRPLYASKKFILIGDPDQLPPVVKNKDALERGYSISLFESLQTEASTIMLNYNYRMNKRITDLANDLTYNGKLLIADEDVEKANLRMPKLEAFLALYKDKQWILKALENDLMKSVCVLDTGPVWDKKLEAPWIQKVSSAHEDASEILKCSNPSETAVVLNLIQALLKGGVNSNSIGVIAPYRAQVTQISLLLNSLNIDVSTVDQFQGQDKEVIIYSCTKSRNRGLPSTKSKFDILEDHRRLTVAITRAKHKFILVADVETIREFDPFYKLFNCIDSEDYLRLVDGDAGFSWESLMKNCNEFKKEIRTNNVL